MVDAYLIGNNFLERTQVFATSLSLTVVVYSIIVLILTQFSVLFAMFDDNDDGIISLDDLLAALGVSSEMPLSTFENVLRETLEKADPDMVRLFVGFVNLLPHCNPWLDNRVV